MANRIIYNSQAIDILVASDGLKLPLFQERNQSRGWSGKRISTINQYGMQEFEVKARFATSVYRQLFAWWSWARQGKPFSFSLDSVNSFDTTLDGSAAAGQKVIPLTQILLNTGFEDLDGADDFSDWTEFESGGGSVEDEGVIIHAGSHAVKITAGGGNAWVYQDITVIPGERYTLYFYTRGDGTYAGRFTIYDLTNLAYIVETSTGVTGTDYTLITREFSVPLGCTTVRIYFARPFTIGTAYFDDAYIMVGASVGDYCLIRAEDNDDEFEIIEK